MMTGIRGVVIYIVDTLLIFDDDQSTPDDLKW
jgi:hypothetical protein